MKILVINCGSSSLKYRLFEDDAELAKGIVERIGQADTPDHNVAVEKMFAQLTDPANPAKVNVAEIEAIGHRVLHGGEWMTDPVIIDRDVISTIDACVPLGPLHNPANLQGIRACMKQAPHATQVAVFDTGFHQTMPDYAYTYPIPENLRKEHSIRRYGFHGTSHYYVSGRMVDILRKNEGITSGSKVVCCHLGNGSSLAAVVDGKCVDTSMGLTPAEGLMMGTRCGDIDPAVLVYLQRTQGWDADRLDKLINKQSGLLAVAGVADMRDVEDRYMAGDPKSRLAFDIFCYRILKYVGAYTAAMDGLDAIAFTGGIGENSPLVRERVCSSLTYLGVSIDPAINEPRSKQERRISTPESKVKVYVVPTDEERVIAQETMKLTIAKKSVGAKA